MVRFATGLRNSIQLRLSLGIAIVILMVGTLGGLVSFWSAHHETYEFQDVLIRQVAAMFDDGHLPAPSRGSLQSGYGDDSNSQVFVEYLHHGPIPLDGPHDKRVQFNYDLPDGLQDTTVNGVEYRVFVKTLGPDVRIVVGQLADLRDEVAWDNAVRTVFPFLILVPILLFVVTSLIRKIFLPLSQLSNEVDTRGEQALYPVETEEVPAEVMGFVNAINRLLERVAQAVQTQRRFVADSAHELRSPLTAVALQAERLASAPMSEEAHTRLETLQGGISRSRQLLEQLLSLAREQAEPNVQRSSISVRAVFMRVLEALMPLAEHKNVDLGIDGDQDAKVASHELELFTLLKNLVDNAIRYSEQGGRVDLKVQVHGAFAHIYVADQGPGIDPALRERVFDPFYRVLGTEQTGSGLGLSIVKTIVDRLGGSIELQDNSRSAHGLVVKVILPLA